MNKGPAQKRKGSHKPKSKGSILDQVRRRLSINRDSGPTVTLPRRYSSGYTSSDFEEAEKPKLTIMDMKEVYKVKTGIAALKAAGMQEAFVGQLIDQLQSTGGFMVLRAGGLPPAYNRKVSPKSGLNLTKTSNQGFFKGALAKNHRFTRIITDKSGEKKPLGHHHKDRARMNATDPDQRQNYTHMTVRRDEILRELREGGDLELIGYKKGEEIRFRYKEGKGNPDFKGEFILKLDEAQEFIPHYARSWDKPENDEAFDREKGIIPLPENQTIIPPDEWESLYHYLENHEVPCYFTDELGSRPVPAEVFADSNGLRIAGDWDGCGLSIPGWVPNEARIEYNTFDRKSDFNAEALIEASEQFLKHYQDRIKEKSSKLSQTEEAVLEMKMEDLYTEFSKGRAGCISPYEFVNNCIANKLYQKREFFKDDDKDKNLNEIYSLALNAGRVKLAETGSLESSKQHAITVASALVARSRNTDILKAHPNLTQAGLESSTIEQKKREEITSHLQTYLNSQLENDADFIQLKSDVSQEEIEVLLQGREHIEIPPINYDINVDNLFQHGYDMRNPYGSNLEGSWLMIHNGVTYYGDTQEQLAKMLLVDGILTEEHQFPITFSADMTKGWAEVIEKQQSLRHFSEARTSAEDEQDVDVLEENTKVSGIFMKTEQAYNKYLRLQSIANELESGTADALHDYSAEIGIILIDYPNHQQVVPNSCIQCFFQQAEQAAQSSGLDQIHVDALKQVFINHQKLLDCSSTSIPDSVLEDFTRKIMNDVDTLKGKISVLEQREDTEENAIKIVQLKKQLEPYSELANAMNILNIDLQNRHISQLTAHIEQEKPPPSPLVTPRRPPDEISKTVRGNDIKDRRNPPTPMLFSSHSQRLGASLQFGDRQTAASHFSTARVDTSDANQAKQEAPSSDVRQSAARDGTFLTSFQQSRQRTGTIESNREDAKPQVDEDKTRKIGRKI